MTGLDLVVIVISAALTVLVVVRGLRAGMRAERQRLEAFRAAAGVPEGRCRIVDVTLVEQLRDLLVPSRRVPPFTGVWAVPPAPPVTVEEVRTGELA